MQETGKSQEKLPISSRFLGGYVRLSELLAQIFTEKFMAALEETSNRHKDTPDSEQWSEAHAGEVDGFHRGIAPRKLAEVITSVRKAIKETQDIHKISPEIFYAGLLIIDNLRSLIRSNRAYGCAIPNLERSTANYETCARLIFKEIPRPEDGFAFYNVRLIDLKSTLEKTLETLTQKFEHVGHAHIVQEAEKRNFRGPKTSRHKVHREELIPGQESFADRLFAKPSEPQPGR